jgi:hypothetical protein
MSCPVRNRTLPLLTGATALGALAFWSAPTSAAAPVPALLRQARELRRNLPARFTVVVQSPFVVVGDEDSDRVKGRAAGTVKWATARLKRAFFVHDPRETITIWLFRDRRSYRSHAWQFFGDRPTTPFGYYSPRHRALVMNIATGGGTLVHEMVHPFMEANFPTCPPWFNEGLGSLYEQSTSRDGEIYGLTNWRLAGLQRAIRARGLPSFRRLTSRTHRQFYDEDPGTNYAQARYLLYYLQQRGLLRRFYRAFVKRRHRDPTGYDTLKSLLRVRNMRAFQRRWERFVLGLDFEG